MGGTQLSTSTEVDIGLPTTARIAGAPAGPTPRRRVHAGDRPVDPFGARAAACSVLAWTLLGLLLGIVVTAAGGDLVRVQAMTVLSGSMRPTLGVGDLVLSQVIRVDRLRPGRHRDLSGQRR